MKSGVYLLSIRKTKIVINENQSIGGSETKYQKIHTELHILLFLRGVKQITKNTAREGRVASSPSLPWIFH